MTDRKHYERLERIFQEASDLTGTDRTEYLDMECGNDPALRQEVEALLAHDETPTGDFIREPVVASLTGEPHPKRIGPYVHLEPIGEGGFADVFRADQTDPVRRKVALKVLKAGLDTRAVLNRFEGERQLLALMDHPSIAKIYDAGTTEKGRPYFAMELVDGDSIVDYCQKHRLDLDTRLALFTRVCAAVQHAHQKGIIHRDLKPSNILVTTVDGSPVPKVIDFGIAKATQVDPSAQTIFTQEGQLIGTPEYISPEQADIGSVNVDTRADIYSLGVVLYQLLTGKLPFSRATLQQAGFVEIMRILREEDPPRPSTRVSALEPDDPDTSTTTSTGLHRKALARHLRKELDWIVLKALEKNPDRRYDSASGFAADITRYLRDEPIEARPPSTLYQVGKFVRRQRVLIATLGAIFVVLTVALVDSDRRRRQVVAAQAEAEAVTDFLTGMLAEADPYQSGKDITVVQVLDTAAESAEGDFEDRPLIRARIENTIGRVYTVLGEADKGMVFLERALETRRALLGDSRETAVTLDYMGRAHNARGEYEAGEPYFRESVAMFSRLLGPGHEETLMTRGNLALLLMDAGRTEEAEAEFLECLNPEYTWPPDNETRLNIMDGFANHYAYQGKLEEAEVLYLEVMETRRRISGEYHPAFSSVVNNLALLRYDQGRVAECDSLLEYNLKLKRVTFGDDHPTTLGAYQNLAGVRSSQGKYAEARAVYEDMLPLVEQTPGEGLYHTVLNNLGYAYLKLEEYARAETLITRAYEIRRDQLGVEHRRTLTSLHNLGLVHVGVGRLTEAESVFEECLEVRLRTLGETHAHTVDVIIELGSVQARLGRYDEATAGLDAVLVVAEAEFGTEHPRYLRALQERALVDVRRGNPATAEPSLLRVCRTLETTQGLEHAQTRKAIEHLVRLYEETGQPEAATEWRAKLP